MKNNQLKPWDNWPKYRLVAKPDSASLQRIEEMRNHFRSLYPLDGEYPEPELAFFSQRMPEASENLLVNWLEKLCANNNRFDIVLNNFSGIPPHLLYMRVQPTAGLLAFSTRLNAVMAQLGLYNSVNAPKPSTWKMNIISGLPDILFDKALQVFSKRELYFQMPVSRLELKRQSTDGEWHLLQRFQFVVPQREIFQPWYQHETAGNIGVV